MDGSRRTALEQDYHKAFEGYLLTSKGRNSSSTRSKSKKKGIISKPQSQKQLIIILRIQNA
jgi:hypothetical protein